jgi:hypothetical protein
MFDRLQLAVEGFDIVNDPEGDVAQLALCMLERPIALLGPTELQPALNRFKNQLNENSARFARVGVIPEMNHNESVAWGGVGSDQDASSSEHVLMLLTWQGYASPSFQAYGLDGRSRYDRFCMEDCW